MFAKSFGQRLRQLREERFLSQQALAEGIDVQIAQISRYERGISMPNAETLADLAKFLRIPVGHLLLGEDDESPNAIAAPIHDLSLLERFRDLEKLDRKDREVAITLIDALIESRHHAEVTTRRRRSA